MCGWVCEPFMFVETKMSSVTFRDILQQFLEPQLIQDQFIYTVVYKKERTPPHFANIVREHLNEVFRDWWNGRGSPRLWAPPSPVLTHLDFFFLGDIKAQLYREKIKRGLPQLRNLIQAAMDTITPQLLKRVFRPTVERWVMCQDSGGYHI